MNKLKSISLVGLLFGAAVFSGCDDKEKQPNIKVENGSLTQIVYADETSGKNDVTFVTSGAWTSAIADGTAKSTKAGTVSWISINPDHGDKAGSYTVSIIIDQNDTGKERAAVITVSCNETDITITVTQKETKEDGTPYVKPTAEVDVYVAGYVSNNTDGTIFATVWKNGVAQTLTVRTSLKGEMPNSSWANSVYVAGNDVYVAGALPDGQIGRRATIWKNGVAQQLGGESNANSIFVAGSNVYVAGLDNWFPVLWKNGVAQQLGTNYDDDARSVFVSGSDVYVAGSNNRKPTIWKNGVAQQLDNNSGRAVSVFVSGSDVYAVGGDGDKVGILWKNGTPQYLPERSFVSSIFVSGSDVYMAGSEYTADWAYSKAVVWKNGTPQYLTVSDGDANSVFVFGNDVYVAGYETVADYKRIAKLWKNGVAQNLTAPNDDARANSVFVVERK